MHRFDTFTNLRVNAGDRQSEITLWPSFTDIMTVVLMIFMLTMVVVIVKNTTLAQALLRSEDQRRQIRSLLQDSETIQAELKNTMTDLEEKSRQKQMMNILLGDEIKLLKQDVEGKTVKLAIFERQTDELKKRIDELQAGITEIQVESEDRLSALTESKAREIEEYNRKVLSLLNQLKEKEAVILTLGDEKQTLEMSLARQRQDFSTLEEKYIQLIRPARSPAGKKVVTVIYQRGNGLYRIGFKGLDNERIETLTTAQLHQQLGALREKWQDQLYVKVIIPEDSGLTYNEAWVFTKDILSRYDYYYQE